MPSKAAPPTAQTTPKHKYRLQFVPSAWAELQKLDGSVKEPLRKLLKKRLDNPHVPGAALHGALTGHYKIKLNKQGYRLVYGVQDDVLIVMVMAVVMAVDKREDSVVYQSAMTRVSEKMAELAKTAQKPLKLKLLLKPLN
jgi:mRNA interferase RelE/StbE